MKKQLAGLFILVTCIITIGCSTTKWMSYLSENEIVINGNHDEWPHLEYNEKHHLSYGVTHDSSHLNICLVVPNQVIQRQMLGSGFLVWFEGDNSSHSLGIKYPIGGGLQHGQGNVSSLKNQNRIPQDQLEKQLTHLTELEIFVGKEDLGDRMTMNEAEAENLIVNCGYREEILVYECQVPLIKSDDCPYGLFEKMPDSVKLIMEVPKPDQETMKAMKSSMRGKGPDGQRGGGGMGGGRQGGMGGRGSGMRGGDRGGQGFKHPEQFNMEVKIQLINKN